MAFFTAQAGGRTYTIERMTLGMWRELKTDFGVTVADLDFEDPNTIIGLLYLAARADRPDAPREELLAEIDDIDIESFAPATDDDDDGVDPTPPGDASPATTRSRSRR